jgi:Ras-related protein Rab-11A
MVEEEDYEMMVKIILIGDSAVGKTNIMSKYLRGQFQENSKATVGVEFGSKLFKIDNHNIKAQIWDTAGQEKYKAITGAYYKGSKGAFVVYDITRKETFDATDRWINDLKISSDPKINIILIGNKSDLEDKRDVLKEQGEEKAKSFGCAFLETSAFNGDNIDKGFEMMISDIFKKFKEESLEEDDLGIIEKGEDINLNKTKANNEKKGCC